MPIQDIDPPPIEPVDLTYTKAFLRVDNDAEDGLITDLIQAARIRIETLLRQSFIARRRLYTTQTVKGCGVFINHSPVLMVETVTAIFEDGTTEPISLDKLEINLRCVPASLRLKRGLRWTLSPKTIQSLEIEMIAGFGMVTDDVPMPLRQAILLLVAESYEHRLQDGDTKEHRTIPMMVDALLMPYRTLRL